MISNLEAEGVENSRKGVVEGIVEGRKNQRQKESLLKSSAMRSRWARKKENPKGD